MLKTIRLHNLLSFGAETEITFNKGLNVLIGANGSGKSNLIEVISLLQALPKDLTKVIRDGGGIEEWLWKGEKEPIARIQVKVINTESSRDWNWFDYDSETIQHTLSFSNWDYRPNVIYESLNNIYIYEERHGYPIDNQDDNVQEARYIYIKSKYGDVIESKSPWNEVQVDINIKTNQSILAQRQDPDTYPEITYIANSYQKIRLYREWQFGRNAIPRTLQRADLPNDFLEENASNLGLILNSFRRNPEIKRKLLESLKLFYENVEDFDVIVQGGYIQVFFEENGFTIPASRLSDGTLRYLCLLAILLHPNPPPLICIEEPELGLHPDILPTLIDLLKQAAEKTQIIITTHSADLVDALSDMPEAVLVFDKYQGSTTVKRLNKEDLTEWLQEYSLGQLWSRGHIGGNRW
jgi:predicted ATPase